jgi:hypothetical protein
MRLRLRELTLVLALASAGHSARSGPSPTDSNPSESSPKLESANIQEEMRSLILEDARVVGQQSAPNGSPLSRQGKVQDPGTGVVLLSPYVVREQKTPQMVTGGYETPFLVFLKTGTLFESVGKKVSTRLYVDGVGGTVRLALTISW